MLRPAPTLVLRLAAMLCAAWLPAREAEVNVPRREAEVGIPYFRNFTPKELGAFPQNWAVLQDLRGVVYVGNNDGILEYDGVRWNLIRTTKHTGIGSLAMDDHGRVYVGSGGEIGYLDVTASGHTRFISLNEKLDPSQRAFSKVWDTLCIPQGVVFISREQLLLYDGTRFRAWKPSSSFLRPFRLGNRIVVRDQGVGLMEFTGTDLRPLPGGERFAKEKTCLAFTLAAPEGSGGGNAEPMAVVATAGGDLFRYDGSRFTPWNAAAAPWLRESGIYKCCPAPGGAVALGTSLRGLGFLDGAGQVGVRVDQEAGLQDDCVLNLAYDRAGGIWLALNKGLARVEWPSPLTVFDTRRGLKGSVLAIRRHQGVLWVGTSHGSFRLVDGTFVPAPGMKGETWDFLSFGSRLLAANRLGMYEWKDGRFVMAWPSSGQVVGMQRDRSDPGRILLGGQFGVEVLRSGPGSTWVDQGPVPGVPDPVHTILQGQDGHWWIGTRNSGVFRLRLSGEAGRSGDPRQGTVERFGLDQGLPSQTHNYPCLVDGKIRFATHKGIFAFDEAGHRFQSDPRYKALFPGQPRWTYGIQESRSGLWLHSVDETTGRQETGRMVRGADGAYGFDPIPCRRFSGVFTEVILPEEDGVVWFGGPDGLVRLDLDLHKEPLWNPAVLIRRVSVKGDPSAASQAIVPGSRLPQSINALRFEFALPFPELESASEYQVRVEGLDSQWSPWSREAYQDYTNLREGSYRFRVRARNGYGVLSPEASFAFTVLPPWYRTWWAYLLFTGCAVGVIHAWSRWRMREHRAQNLKLRKEVEAATQDLQVTNLQLRELNEQKNQFLGIVAHDLRNPLGSIVLAAQLLEEVDDLDLIHETGRRIYQEGMDMSGLIGRFLDIARIESGQIKAEPEPFDLAALTRHIAQRHADHAEGKGISLVFDLPDSFTGAYADPKFVKEILDNLISNAVKFSSRASTITLRVQATAESTCVTVEDQGPGISAEDQEKLFGRFARLSAKPTGGEKSIGLGLHIVKHLVEATGGRIWVESEPGKGAAFHVSLPVPPEL